MVPFDPYLNWLGIPAHEQPANFYRLLGIVLFESNPQVIAQAADRQSLLVGANQSGPHDGLCQQLLSEIAMAQLCLLDPQRKAAYDAQLQDQLAHRGERAVMAAPPPGYRLGPGGGPSPMAAGMHSPGTMPALPIQANLPMPTVMPTPATARQTSMPGPAASPMMPPSAAVSLLPFAWYGIISWAIAVTAAGYAKPQSANVTRDIRIAPLT